MLGQYLNHKVMARPNKGTGSTGVKPRPKTSTTTKK